MHSKRNTSAPQLVASSPPPSPTGLWAPLALLLPGSPAMKRLRTWYQQLSRLYRRARYWNGWAPLLWNVAKVVVLGLHLALVILAAKCLFFPADTPREEWVPAKWGTPWSDSAHSWAQLASRRKAELFGESGGGQLQFNNISLWDKLGISAPSAALDRGSGRGSGAAHGSQMGAPRPHGGKPPRLRYPILWAAPFFSRSGYGTEAISYIAGLLEHGLVAPEDLWITQAGDGRHPDALDGLDPAVRQLLWDQEWHNITRRLSPKDRDRPIIVVCHVFPDCWRTQADDLPYRNWLVRGVMWMFKEIKVRLVGKHEDRDNGCPCPNEYIKDRVAYRVGRSMFETERLPAPLVSFSEDLDEVLVPSQFSVDSFSRSGIPLHKLHTLPQGINTTLFDPSKYSPVELSTLQGQQVTGPSRPYNASTPPHEGLAAMQKVLSMVEAVKAGRHDHATLADQAALAASLVKQHLSNLEEVILQAGGKPHSKQPEHKQHQRWHGGSDANTPFRFLSVFKWETRKGWDILLKAYFDEFSPTQDNVELHVVTHAFGAEVKDFREFMREAVRKLLNVSADSHLDARLPRVYVYDKYIPDSMYPGLYQAMDALVVPTHGEGWGRPQFEAMAMGVPVISTNWSGLTAFMDDKVAYPIRVEAVVEVVDPSPDAFAWFKGQRWAQPSRAHLQQLMREVMHNRRRAWAKGQLARQRVQEEYSILAVARKALAEIQRIEATVEAIMSDGASPREGLGGGHAAAAAGGLAGRRALHQGPGARSSSSVAGVGGGREEQEEGGALGSVAYQRQDRQAQAGREGSGQGAAAGSSGGLGHQGSQGSGGGGGWMELLWARAGRPVPEQNLRQPEQQQQQQ